MRAFRFVVVGVLVAGALAVVAPEANAQEPAVPEICASLATLSSKLAVITSGFGGGNLDIDALRDLSIRS